MEDIADKLSNLGRTPLFSSLSPDELRLIVRYVHFRHFEKDQVILFERDTNKFMYVVLSGRVKVVRITEDGREILMAFHVAPESFGEISLIDQKTNPAAVVAMEKSQIAIISREDFHSILASQTKVMKKLLVLMAERLRESWEKIHFLSFNNAPDRISALFFMLSGGPAAPREEETILDLKMTHQDIASMCGLTRETVTRVLDRWQNDRLLTVMKGRKLKLSPRFFQNPETS
jgi:CRP/FNR family transcriptional regulator